LLENVVVKFSVSTVINSIYGHFTKEFAVKYSFIRFIMAIFSVVIINVSNISHNASDYEVFVLFEVGGSVGCSEILESGVFVGYGGH
jgi:hypothetical protein